MIRHSIWHAKAEHEEGKARYWKRKGKVWMQKNQDAARIPKLAPAPPTPQQLPYERIYRQIGIRGIHA